MDDRPAPRSSGAEPAKAEFEDGRPLLRPKALTLMRRAEPGAGLELADHGEVRSFDALRADRLAAQVRDQVQRPPLRLPRLPGSAMEVEEAVELKVIRPGNEEGHLFGRMDAALGHVEELD